MKYTDWKLLTESIGSGITLGLSKPNIIGGLIGSHLSEKEVETEDDIENEEEPEDDAEESSEEGHEEVDNSEKKDPMKAVKKFMNKNFMNDDKDSDFLKDIDPDLLGNNTGSEEADDMGSEEADDMGSSCGDEEANADADVASVDGEDDRMKDTMDLMKMMASYCGKYMKSESNEGGLTPAQEKLPPKLKAAILKKNNSKKSKKDHSEEDHSEEDHSEESKVKSKKNCNCESNSFLDSLTKQTSMKKSIAEDSLFTQAEPSLTDSDDSLQPGDVGFAPQGKIGSIGGGYTKDDFADIPVLGESHKFPTLTEWMANRSANKN